MFRTCSWQRHCPHFFMSPWSQYSGPRRSRSEETFSHHTNYTHIHMHIYAPTHSHTHTHTHCCSYDISVILLCPSSLFLPSSTFAVNQYEGCMLWSTQDWALRLWLFPQCSSKSQKTFPSFWLSHETWDRPEWYNFDGVIWKIVYTETRQNIFSCPSSRASKNSGDIVYAPCEKMFRQILEPPNSVFKRKNAIYMHVHTTTNYMSQRKEIPIWGPVSWNICECCKLVEAPCRVHTKMAMRTFANPLANVSSNWPPGRLFIKRKIFWATVYVSP